MSPEPNDSLDTVKLLLRLQRLELGLLILSTYIVGSDLSNILMR